MKHEDMIRRVIAKLIAPAFEPWMDDADKQEFFDETFRLMGEEMDEAIEQGVRNGCPPVVQEALMPPYLEAAIALYAARTPDDTRTP